MSLQWRHNGRDGISNHQPHDCLLNRLFRRRSKKTSKFRVTGLCAGIHRWPVNSPHKGPVTRKMFPFDDVIISRRGSCHTCGAFGCWADLVILAPLVGAFVSSSPSMIHVSNQVHDLRIQTAISFLVKSSPPFRCTIISGPQESNVCT